MTQEQIAKYVQNGGTRCPLCDSDDLSTTGPIESDYGAAWQEVECKACGQEWRDLYSLTGIDEQESPDAKS